MLHLCYLKKFIITSLTLVPKQNKIKINVKSKSFFMKQYQISIHLCLNAYDVTINLLTSKNVFSFKKTI